MARTGLRLTKKRKRWVIGEGYPKAVFSSADVGIGLWRFQTFKRGGFSLDIGVSEETEKTKCRLILEEIE